MAGRTRNSRSADGTEIAFLRHAAPDRIEVRKVRARSAGSTDASDSLICKLRARANTSPGLSWSPDGALLASAEPSGPEDQMRLVLYFAAHRRKAHLQ